MGAYVPKQEIQLSVISKTAPLAERTVIQNNLNLKVILAIRYLKTFYYTYYSW